MTKKQFIREILDWVLHIGVAVLIGLLIVKFVAQMTIVSGYSMETTLQNGDRLIVEKISNKLGNIDRGDIVTIDHPRDISDEDSPIIKRVIGIEGDLVEIKEGKVYLNGVALKEDYTLGNYTEEVIAQYSKVKVKPGEIYVLGDNRTPSGSLDSRSFGPKIIKEKVLGRAFLRVYPFNKIRLF